jgi:L-ascorbate metabolism protein UlaG (beta-lactamase superfamily)
MLLNLKLEDRALLMPLRSMWCRTAIAVAALLLNQTAVQAASAVDRCLAVASVPGVRSVPVKFRPGGLAANEARLTFIGHSTFLLESPEGVKVATDFNDYVRPPVLPDIATMNRAHSSHYTDAPSPTIKHVLRGWNPDGGAARHDLEYKDVHVRNIATNTRWGETGSTGAYGNSIFVFQLAGLCIGHLGHLHHTLTPEQLGAIGQLDVVLVPVDGGYTMDTAGMVEVMKTLRARLIIPMHYFNQFTLTRFLDRVRSEWPIEMADRPDVVLSQRTLPVEPKILVLPGQ